MFILIPASAVAEKPVPDEMFQISNPPGQGYLGYTAYSPNLSGFNGSGLIGMKTGDKDKVETVNFCSSLQDPKCTSSDFFQFQSIFPVCTNSSQLDCVETIFAEDLQGKALEVTNAGPFSLEKNHSYIGSREISLPSGGTTSLFNIPGAPHSEGTLYLPVISIYGQWDTTTFPPVKIHSISINLYAVKIIKGNFSFIEMSTQAQKYAGKYAHSIEGNENGCIYNDSALCAVAFPLPTEIKFGIKARFGTEFKGWFHGRLQSPNIEYISNSNGGKTLTASGFAVKVPSMTIWKKKSELSPALKTLYAKRAEPIRVYGGWYLDPGINVSEGTNSYMMRNWSQSEDELNEFLTWLPIFEDKATFRPTVWNLNFMTQELSIYPKEYCKKDVLSLTGIVSTNATQYLSGPPIFNPSSQELEYKVAGPHFLPDGELSRGSYDLTIRSDFARCLYNITGNAFKAVISIVSESGATINATTSIAEKDGWMYLSARGFTFSNPTLKVKLVQDAASPEVTPTPMATSGPKIATSRLTITCTKGKVNKKVTAVAPKCPTGYKKKG